jgi:hypothetical protein
MIGMSPQLLLAENLNILHNIREYPAMLENVKNFQSSLEVFGDTYTITTSTICHLQYTVLFRRIITIPKQLI